MVTPIQLKWFRIEQDASGAILSCEEVDAKGRKGAHVRFYEAVDKAEACSYAKQWYAIHLQRLRKHGAKYRARPDVIAASKDKSAARRAALIAEGKCFHCGRVVPLVTTVLCAGCRDRKNEIKRRKNAGLQPLHPKPRRNAVTPETALSNARQWRQAHNSRSISVWGSVQAQKHHAVLKRFDNMTPAQFRRDLIARILQLGGAAAAKALGEYEASRAESLDKATTAAYKRAAKAKRGSEI